MTSFRNILFIISLLIISNPIYSQTPSYERPRLIIGIIVDGLQQKHIDYLWNYLEPGGFKRLIEQGTSCRNVSYNIVSSGDAADIATVMTGSIPYYHGITGNAYFKRSDRTIHSIIEDENQSGIGTTMNVSAHNLLASTISDELYLAFPEKSKTYAIAIRPEDAIMLGGHTAKSVAWIDNVSLKWVTTTYYSEGLSQWADKMNTDGTFNNIVAQKWEPLYNINTYLSKPNKEDKKWGFYYDPTSRVSQYSPTTILKNTPAANTLVAALAQKIIEGENLGNDAYPDMLLLQFTVRPPNENTFALQSAEKEDMYLRLDKDIETLLQKIDVKIGLDKTLVYMFANQTGTHSPAELGMNKIPAGYFNARRSMALLSSYLIAIYGEERWIDGYYGKNIFLNKSKIEEKKINFKQMQQTVADFMLEFEGIQSAFTSSQIVGMSGNTGSEMFRIRNSMHKNTVGDVIFTLLPGWIEVDDKNKPVGESNAIVSYTPLYFFGWHIKPRKVDAAYQTTDIAPTLSRLLNIPMPNAATGKPIEEIVK